MQLFKPEDIIGNRYRVKRILGKGGQVQVYLCEESQNENREVVLKELIFKSVTEKSRTEELALFEQEAKILEAITHPNLPKMYGIFEEQSLHFICEEYIEGVPVDKFLKQSGGRLSESDALSVALQMVSLLEFLHNHNPPVIIRDIKPPNMIFTREGKLYFIDFTIARYLIKDKEDTVRMGSPGYAPPEQYRGLSTPQSDIYSLGVTLHQLLTGHNPITTPFTLPLPRKVRRNINPLWDDILSRATDLDTKARYQNVFELKEDLTKLEMKLKLSQPQNVLSLSRYRRILSATAAVILVIIASAVIFSLGLQAWKVEFQKSMVCLENLTKISLALQVYADEHNEFPRSIEELVPLYMSTLPVCPGAEKFNYGISESRVKIEMRDGKEYETKSIKVFCRGRCHKYFPRKVGSPFKIIEHRRVIEENEQREEKK